VRKFSFTQIIQMNLLTLWAKQTIRRLIVGRSVGNLDSKSEWDWKVVTSPQKHRWRGTILLRARHANTGDVDRSKTEQQQQQQQQQQQCSCRCQKSTQMNLLTLHDMNNPPIDCWSKT
jgi:hypothetical protein